MSRIVKTSTKVKLGMKIANYYTDKTNSSTTLFVDDIVTDMKYIEDSELKTATGRISAIDVNFLKVSKDFDVLDDAKIGNIVVDASKAKQSKLITIPSEELIEYNAEAKEVQYVKATPVLIVDFKSTLSDGSSSSMTFTQGMNLFNVEIQKYDAVLKGDFVVKAFMYKINHNYGKPVVYGMILEGETEEKVLFEDIKSCGSEGIVVTETDNLSDVIAGASSDETVGFVLPAAKFSDALTIGNKVTIVGNKEAETASCGARATDAIAGNETVILNTVTGEAGADIVIKGVAFTENCYINPNGATSVTFKNCKFVESVPNKVQSLLLYDNEYSNNEPRTLLLQIEGCYFGTNTTSEDNKMYNLINLYAKIADGSYIKNCYFAKECMTHNIINFYNVEDGATIEISGNHFEKSSNAVRLGFIGHPKCKVIINNNIYDDTDTANPEYAGLLLVQPHGDTETFEDVEIEMYGNKFTGGEEKQVGYFYPYIRELTLTREQAPKVRTDGYFNFWV